MIDSTLFGAPGSHAQPEHETEKDWSDDLDVVIGSLFEPVGPLVVGVAVEDENDPMTVFCAECGTAYRIPDEMTDDRAFRSCGCID